jgi:hypothetical protein
VLKIKSLLLGFCLMVFCSGIYGNDREQQITLDIVSSKFADSYETLLAGEREMIVIVNEATTPITRGVAVLVGEAGQSPLSHDSLAPLIPLLNQYGWVTILMPAPASAFFGSTITTETAQPPEQSAERINPLSGLAVLAEEVFTKQETELLQQLQTIKQRSNDYPGFFIVVAQGTSAAWIAKIYSEKTLPTPDALVVLSPYWPDRKYNILIPELIANTDMPLLDFYSRSDNKWATATQPSRKIIAEKVLKLHYRQTEIISQRFDAERYQLISKDIYGWLTHMGW